MKEIICPSCRRPLPPNSPQGLCPICALKGAKDSSPTAGIPAIEDIQASFPEFEIKECIGRGGMGIVYRASQATENREVALKILDPALSEQADFAERFAREARTLEQLDHPNIVAIYEFGQNDDFYWFTMELVDGVNLRQAMQTAQLTPQQALDIIPGLCAALQYAHENGVFHRDVKPENILLDTDGNVKVADFGIARLMGEKAEFTLTRTGSTLGSTAYMAPEQIESPQDVDHRADIYSLGVVFYEMLTGSLPLGRFPAPSEKTGSHPGLDEVVFRALQKEREKRFQNANDISREVASPTTTQSVFPLKGPLPWANIAIWAVIIGILSVLVGAVVNDTIAALGLITCLAGLLGCWWLLAEIRAGRHNKEDRPKLMRVSVKAPLCLLFLSLIPLTLFWLSYSPSEEARWEAEKRQRAATAAHLKAQMSYDHSTPDAAMRSVIQAARNKDTQGFAIGIQGDIVLAALQEDPGLASMMQDYAKLRFSKVSSAENGKAQVLVRSKKERRLYNLIQEIEGWRIVGEYPTQALDEIALLERDVKAMIAAAEKKDFDAFRHYLSEPVLVLTKNNPDNQNEALKDWSRLTFVRIESMNIATSPKLGNVIFSANGNEVRFSYQLENDTWRLLMPDHMLQERFPVNEALTNASETEIPKTVGIDYSSPIAAFDATLAVAKVKNEQLFAKSFTDSYPSQLKELELTPAQAIERFLRSPEAILKFKSRIDLRNPQDAKQATLILKLDEQTFQHQMVLEAGQWRFVEPFFLKL